MNYLAHIYLSGQNELVRIGNFMADSVRGKSYEAYSDALQTGILLHRFIDQYTDSHQLVKKGTARLHEKHGHYSSVIIDIFYDHFLAKNWHEYHQVPLESFCNNFYTLIQDNFELLTPKMQQIAPVMIRHNWLLHYRELEGIRSVLGGMSRRARFQNNMDKAVLDLTMYYPLYEEEFRLFFEDIRHECDLKLTEITKNFNQK